MFMRTIPESSLLMLLTRGQRGVIAVCDGAAGAIKERLKLLELQFDSPCQNRYITPEPALGPQQVCIF